MFVSCLFIVLEARKHFCFSHKIVLMAAKQAAPSVLLSNVCCLYMQMGEVWREIMGELEIENVRPVSPDLEALETIGRAITEDSRSVVLIQKDLLKAQTDQASLGVIYVGG